MPGVWKLDTEFDYDAASQGYADSIMPRRVSEAAGGAPPGIRVKVTMRDSRSRKATLSPTRRRTRAGARRPHEGGAAAARPNIWHRAETRPASESAARPSFDRSPARASRGSRDGGGADPGEALFPAHSRANVKLDVAVDPTTRALERRWDPTQRPKTTEGAYRKRAGLTESDAQLRMRPATAIAGVGARRRIELVRPVFRPPRLAEREAPARVGTPAWAEYVEPPPSHRAHDVARDARQAARTRADALQSQWLANLPKHLPVDRTWRKDAALDDPTTAIFWNGSLHTPAVRCFMTPTVVHKTRANALRRTMFAVRTQLYDD